MRTHLKLSNKTFFIFQKLSSQLELKNATLNFVLIQTFSWIRKGQVITAKKITFNGSVHTHLRHYNGSDF